MKREETNILKAVSSIVKFPTVEDSLCEGHIVSLEKFRNEVGERFVLPNSKLCISHVKSLANSIEKHSRVYLPIIVERTEDGFYKVTDGMHRLVALDVIKEKNPNTDISINVKLNTHE